MSSFLGRSRYGLPFLVLAVVLAATGLAVAHVSSSDGPPEAAGTPGAQVDPVSAEAMTAYERLCGTDSTCAIVPGAHDPSDASLPVAERVAAHGRPASDCPDAAAVYDQAGPPVDVFLGPCPSLAAVEKRLAGTDAAVSDARFERAMREAEALRGSDGP